MSKDIRKGRAVSLPGTRAVSLPGARATGKGRGKDIALPILHGSRGKDIALPILHGSRGKDIALPLLLLLISFLIPSCTEKEEVNYRKREIKTSDDPIQQYINLNYLDKYNTSVIWKWDDTKISINYYVTPPKQEAVLPALKMSERFWLSPFKKVSAKGEEFVKNNIPSEIVLIGSPIYNEDGTRTLGFAEGGVRITISEVDALDTTNAAWLNRQLHTIHHEFNHIVHQNAGLPKGYEKISASKYTGNSWTSLTENDAIKIGCVTPYGTTNEFEDYCELISTFLISGEKGFKEKYFSKTTAEIQQLVTDTTAALFNNLRDAKKRASEQYAKNIKKLTDKDLQLFVDSSVAHIVQDSAQYIVAQVAAIDQNLKNLNEGKAVIEQKFELIKEYYQSNFEIDILQLKTEIQNRISASTKK